MAKKSAKRKQKKLLNQVCHPNAGGIDIGSREIMAAVGADKSDDPVRAFSTHNQGLREAVAWLKECGIETVAFEATGNYWVCLYDFLQTAGIAPWLVNARHVKGVPGRKTDVQDAQWLQQLHTAGLVRRSFVPDQEVLSLRYLQRHRDDLVRGGGREIQHMQKVFNEMNVQLHHVISDIDGWSGQRIIKAIIEGERDPETLADLRHSSCKTPRGEVILALDGNYRDEYILVLKQCYHRWQQAHQQITEVDRQIGQMLSQFERDEPCDSEKQDDESEKLGRIYIVKPASEAEDKSEAALPIMATRNQSKKREPVYDIQSEAARIYGTDLTLIPGVSSGVLSALLTEIGGRNAFIKKFKSGHHLASWLGLCPDNRISGNKNLGSKTRKVKSRLAYQLRMGAMTLWRSESELGQYSRRMKSKLGKPEGITATAHKMIRIIYKLIATATTYEDKIAGNMSESRKQRRIKGLQKAAERLGFQLIEAQTV